MRPRLGSPLRPFLPLAAGLALSPGLRAAPWLLFAAAALAALGWRTRLRTAALAVALGAAGLAAGNLRIAEPVQGPLRESVRAAAVPPAFWVRGTVTASESAPEGSRVVMAVGSFEERGRWRADGSRLRAVLPVPPPAEGSPLEASLLVALPRPLANPGQFDLRERLARGGVSLTAVCRDPALVKVGEPPAYALAARYRRALRGAIARDAGDQAGLVLALLLGDRGRLEPADQEHLGRSGLFHLVALSGMNVAMLLLLFSAAAHLTGLHPAARDAASLGIVAFFGLLVGPVPSLGRAVLMAALFLLARLLDRPQPGLAGWTLALAGLLLWDPLWILDTGFQLTFAAVLGILLLGPRYPRFLPQGGWAEPVARLFWMGAAAQLFTLPFLAWTFHRIAWAGVLATPLASLPLFLVLGAGLPYLAGAAFLPGVRTLLGALLALGAKAFLWLPDLLGREGWGLVFLPRPWGGWLVLYGAALTLTLLPGRRALAGWVGMAAVAMGAWACPRPWDRPRPGCLAVLDVGQASCQAVLGEGSCVLVDCGNGNYRGPTSARTVVEPFLAEAGLDRVDGVVLTHWDADHSGGLADLVADLPVGFLAYPAADPPVARRPVALAALCRSRGVRLVPLSRGQRFRAGGLDWEVWHPGRLDAFCGENDRSLAAQVRIGGGRYGFTGDLEATGERTLLASGTAGPLAGLLVPHHGSRTSSAPELVAALRPRLAFFSVGRWNRYGHPDPEVEARYRAAGALCFRTDRDGALLVEAFARRPRVLRMADGDWSAELAR